MRRTGITKEDLFDYIIQAFFEQLETTNFYKITVLDIVQRAGVSRSTYYRYFDNKENIVKSFSKGVIEECLAAYALAQKSSGWNGDHSQRMWLLTMFSTMKKYDSEIALLRKNGLTSLLLEVLNESFLLTSGNTEIEQYKLRYHLGGLFNCFMLWIENGIQKSPQEMTAIVMEALPENYVPIMPQLKTSLL